MADFNKTKGYSQNNGSLENTLRYILSIVNEHQRFVEAKNLVIVALGGGSVYTLLSFIIDNNAYEITLLIFLFQLLAGSIIVTMLALISLFPRMNNCQSLKRHNKPDKINYFFFGHLAILGEDKLLNGLRDLLHTSEGFSPIHYHYANQIIINSAITKRKAFMFKIIITVFVFSLIPYSIIYSLFI